MRQIKFLICLIGLVFLLTAISYGQISIGGKPQSFQKASVKSVAQFQEMGTVDVAAMLAEDEVEEQEGLPYRFGAPFDVNFNLQNSGEWEVLPDASRIWRLRIASTGAYSINLIYDNFYLPPGAELYVYSQDKSMVIGAFTEANNKPSGRFATSPVKGGDVIVEYYEPLAVQGEGHFAITRIVHAYKDIFNFGGDKSTAGYGGSGSCNVNVNCEVGIPWVEESQAVAMILLGDGFRLCTGSLINNVREDETPYFLTANHCSSDSSGAEVSWIIMFRYESPGCDNVDGPTYNTVQGAEVIASNPYSDFKLVELSEAPPASYNVTYLGWSNEDTPPSGAVGIHHPSGDIKKISIEYDALTTTDNESTTGLSHWRVGDWDVGTTERGSSGSALFDQNHRLVGQLHGGWAECGNELADWYGKFSDSWDYGSDQYSRLRDWLDPDNTNYTFTNSYTPPVVTAIVDYVYLAPLLPQGYDYSISVNNGSFTNHQTPHNTGWFESDHVTIEAIDFTEEGHQYTFDHWEIRDLNTFDLINEAHMNPYTFVAGSITSENVYFNAIFKGGPYEFSILRPSAVSGELEVLNTAPYEIRWRAPRGVNNSTEIYIELSTDGQTSWTSLAGPLNYNYPHTPGAGINGELVVDFTGISSDNCYLRISGEDSNGNAGEIVSHKFSIVSCLTPVVSFIANETSGIAPLPVTFGGDATRPQTSWLWDFGDGTTSTEQNPVHIYNEAGIFTVTLTATNACGSSGYKTITDFVTVTCDPIQVDFRANHTTDPISGDSPLLVEFYDWSTPACKLATYRWEYGDGTYDEGPNCIASHTYQNPGTYSVTLTITTVCDVYTRTKNDIITVYYNGPPVADFIGSPTSGMAPISVNFTDQSYGDITSWLWDFGDGTTSDLQNPSHTYTSGGNYTVSLTVTGPHGEDTETRVSYLNVASTVIVPVDYSTIQDAIDAVNDGSTIIVHPGTYSGVGFKHIDFKGKAITVISAAGAANTTIDLENAARGFVFMSGEGRNSVLDGFRIINGHGAGYQLYLPYVSDGGGIIIRSASPTIRNCVIEDCDASSNSGGAIDADHSYGSSGPTSPLIESCTFRRNTAGWGGAISLGAITNAFIHDCIFEYNTATNYGGAVNNLGFEGSYAYLTHSTFVGNGATSGGGFKTSGPTEISHCTFAKNHAGIGGGIRVESMTAGGTLNLNNTVVANNTGGSGLVTDAVATVTYDCNVFGSNVGGDITGEQPAPTSDLEVEYADPLFCDLDNDNIQVASNSVCLPANNACNTNIGHWGQGCGYQGNTFWVENAHGDDVTGDGTESAPFLTIGHAISLAADRDTIMVGPGLYEENIDFSGKLLTVHGYLGPDVTILKPAIPDQSTITMMNGEPVGTDFSGFTVTGGGDSYTVYVAGDAQPLIHSNVFYKNFEQYVGGQKQVIRSGLAVGDNSHPTIRDNLFYDNLGHACIGLFYGAGTVLNNTFDNNVRSIFTITPNSIAKNNIITNSDVFGVYGNWLTFTDNNVWNNTWDYWGSNADPLLNISDDPLYMDAANGTYFIEHNSPSEGTGEGGVDMGAFQAEYVGEGNHVFIQNAIDASSNGGYVLVYPGTYIESLNFLDKGVKVISTAGVGSTILLTAATPGINFDAADEEWSQLSGFFIQDLLSDNATSMCVANSDANVLISSNEFSECNQGDVGEIHSVIAADDSRMYISRNLFRYSKGTTISLGSKVSQVVNNTFFRGSTALHAAGPVSGIALNNIIYEPSTDYLVGSWTGSDYNLLWDGGTAIGPHDILADPLLDLSTLSLQAASPCVDAGHPDEFYLDPGGSLNDMGAIPYVGPPYSVEVPGDYTTIQDGINAVIDGGEVHVAAGVFTENINFMGKTIRVIGAGNVDGDTTFLEPAIADNPTVSLYTNEGVGTELTGFTIRNGGNSITVTVSGGSSLRLGENVFYNNVLPASTDKSIVRCQGTGTVALIERNLFYDNNGMCCVAILAGGYAEIINNTFDNNARGILVVSNSGGMAKNNIITNSTDFGIYGSQWLELSYNDVYNNGFDYHGGAIAGTGSISLDPLFVNASNGDYDISFLSPCVNAGDPDPAYNDPDGSRNDMGAFPATGLLNPQPILKDIDGLPDRFALFNNYPNPFNPATTIKYNLPVSTNVKLVVYNIIGQEVATLVNRHQPAGRYEIQWGSTTDNGSSLASGVYLYRLSTEEFNQTKKMLLIK